MIKEQIQQLETIIDKEIDGYKNIEKLYADKKNCLYTAKPRSFLMLMQRFKTFTKTSAICQMQEKM